MENSPQIICSFCHSVIPGGAYFFCPICGKPLRDKPLSVSVARQAVIYLISFFLAPFGLIYVRKYLKQTDEKSRQIGYVALILTVAGICIFIWVYLGFINSYTQMLNSITE